MPKNIYKKRPIPKRPYKNIRGYLVATVPETVQGHCGTFNIKEEPVKYIRQMLPTSFHLDIHLIGNITKVHFHLPDFTQKLTWSSLSPYGISYSVDDSEAAKKYFRIPEKYSRKFKKDESLTQQELEVV